jgi:hypothetical protein
VAAGTEASEAFEEAEGVMTDQEKQEKWPFIGLPFTHRKSCGKRMTNLDGSIDAGFAEALKDRPCVGEHTAWDHCGFVWYADGQFHEEVWVYNVAQKVFSAPTLRELMDGVNAEFGTD